MTRKELEKELEFLAGEDLEKGDLVYYNKKDGKVYKVKSGKEQFTFTLKKHHFKYIGPRVVEYHKTTK